MMKLQLLLKSYFSLSPPHCFSTFPAPLTHLFFTVLVVMCPPGFRKHSFIHQMLSPPLSAVA